MSKVPAENRCQSSPPTGRHCRPHPLHPHATAQAAAATLRFPASLPPVILGPMDARDIEFMRLALEEARAAECAGEVPIGAVVVQAGEVIARAGNRTVTDCDPTAHAEIVALREAARAVRNHRLGSAILYVTIEPCAMCAGAMVQARIERVVYGADDPKGGAVTSSFAVLDHPQLNHRVTVTAGVLQEECAALLQSFFAARR